MIRDKELTDDGPRGIEELALRAHMVHRASLPQPASLLQQLGL